MRANLPRIARLRAVTGLALAAVVLSDASWAQDPFAPSLRWIHQAPIAAPWIPQTVSFAIDENMVWSSGSGAATQVMALDVEGQPQNTPRFNDLSVFQALSEVHAVGTNRPDALFTAAQYADPDIFHRRTEVTRHDPVAASLGAPFTPVWMHDMGFVTNGPTHLVASEDGEIVVVAAWNNVTSKVHVHWLDGTSGSVVSTVVAHGAALSEIRISDDGKRLAVAAGLDLYVFDEVGRGLFHEQLVSATRALALSADGQRLVVGGMSDVTVFEEEGPTYQPLFHDTVASNLIATCAAVSDQGETIAIGWWNFSNGVDVELEIRDGQTFDVVQSMAQSGNPGGLQNFAEAVSMSANGQRVLFGCWGNGATDPEVVLLDRGSAEPIMEIDLPGSVHALALDSTGTRVLVGHKDTHANQFGITGAVRLYDTGERELQVLSPIEIGGTVHLAAKDKGASTAFFLIGDLAPPSQIPGVGGTLFLDRQTLTAFARPANDKGRADLQVPIAPNPALVGVTLAVQGAFREGAALTLTDTVLNALILNP